MTSILATAFDTFLGLPGLRGFWPLSSFDESGNAYDISGWGGTLARNGNPTYNVNPQGTCYLDFDGTGDYLSFADHAHFDILGTESYVAGAAQGLTVGGWFWFDGFSPLSGAIGKYTSAGNQKSHLLYVTSTGNPTGAISTNGSVDFLVGGTALSAGAWHFLVLRFDPSTELAIFADKAKWTNTTSIPASLFNSTAAFEIGAFAGAANFLNGRAAMCFLSAEVISDALLDDLFDASEPLFNAVISEAETVTLTETVSRRLVSQPKPAETITLTEAVNRNLVSQPKPAETVTLSEAATASMARQIGQAETVTLSEAASVSQTRQTSQAETVTLSETVTRNLVAFTAASETVTLSEAATASISRAVSQAETVTLAEAQALSVSGAQISQNQAVTLTEAQTVNVSQAQVSQAETVTLSEAVTRNLIAFVSAAETVTLTETVSRNLVGLLSAAETVTLTETATANMTRQTSQAETVTLTEGVTANMPRSVGQNETVTLTEAQSVTVQVARVSTAETVTLTEAQTVRVATATVSQNETVTLTEAQSLILADRLSAAETITLSEAGTTVLLVSVVGQGETVTLSEGVTVALAAFSVSAGETVTVGEIVLVNAGSGLLITVSEIVTLSEATGAATFEIVTIVLYDTLALSEQVAAPMFSVTDTLTLSDGIVGTVADTLTLTDEITIGNVTMIVTDTLTFSEVLALDGPTVPPPAAAATSELDYNPVLKLLYGNDKRDPIRELDLAQLAPGAIRLMAGGFAPGAGERNELWSGESVRFDGQKKLAESRKNSQLAVTYVLKTAGSQAALSYFQRKINRFFTEAKQHQLLGQNYTVWLEYRWSDGLPDLAIPTFGQLSNYYEVFSATAPKWPDSLHDDLQSLTQGQIVDVLLNIVGSPAPEGLKQRAALAGGTITLHDKGVLIASGATSKLHWAGYTDSGLTGNFTITGWMTLNAVWGSGNKDVFDYYVDASNRIRIIYDAGNNRWTITKIVSGSTFTANSSTDAVTNGDDVHLQLVQDSTTLRLYVNGVSAVSVAATATMTDGGTIALGCPATGTVDGVDVILDGWRILPDDITSTQALALYEAELPIKQDGGQIGPPPYFWTTGGAGQVSGCDDATYNNWGIIGGAGGDLEAKTDIRLQTGSELGHHIFYYGVRAQDETYTPSSTIFQEISVGTQVFDATASGGQYRQSIGTSLTFYKSATPSVAPHLFFGKYQLLARLKLPGSSVTITPKFEFATNFLDPIIGKSVTHTGSNTWQLVDLGTLFITSDAEPIAYADTVPFNLRILITSTASITAQADFLMLMPYPFARLSNSLIPSTTTPFYVVAEEGRGYMYSSSGDTTQDLHFEYRGDELTVVPNKYNYLFAFQTTSGGVQAVADTVTLAVYVTPRYLLPGGMVA